MKLSKYLKGLFLVALSPGLVACSIFSGGQYQLPDYYETSLIPQDYTVGQTYNLKDLRCSQVSGICDRQDYVQRRQYEKPYYLSK